MHFFYLYFRLIFPQKGFSGLSLKEKDRYDGKMKDK